MRHTADNSKESFIFSLSNNHKFVLKKPETAISNHIDYGPAFGEYGQSLYIYDKGNIENKNGASFNESYQNNNYQNGLRDTKVKFCGDPGNPHAWYYPNQFSFKLK
jgi:hypothetical protein